MRKWLIVLLIIMLPCIVSCGDRGESAQGFQMTEVSGELQPEEESGVTEQETQGETGLEPSEKERPAVKGIYVTGPVAGSERMNDLITLVDATELNTMVIDVKNDEGEITWKMDTGSVLEMGNGVAYIRDIGALMETLKEHDIYTVARIVCFKDPVFAQNHINSALRKPDGGFVTDAYGLAWVNPYDEEVWAYLTEIAQAAKSEAKRS